MIETAPLQKVIVATIKGKKADEVFDGPRAGARPYLQIADLHGESKQQFALSHKGVVAESQDLLIAWDGANAGTVSWGLAGYAGSTLAVMKLNEEVVDTNYSGYFLRSNFKRLNSQTTGATIPHIDPNVLYSLEIPLPPLAEQRRIAAILDKADALRRKAQQALDLTDDLIRSTFLDMFGDPVTNPKRWPMVTIRDLVVEAKYGSSQKAGTEGRWPMLRMNNITYSGGWDFSELKYLDLHNRDVPKYTVRAGDMLFNRTNSKELVGKTAVYRGEKSMAFAGYLIRVRANEEADTEYIAAYLNTGHGKATLMGMCKAIIGMANINAQELQSIPILKPPVGLQREFAKIVRAIDAKRENPKRVIQETEALFSSCLQRAFTGGL